MDFYNHACADLAKRNISRQSFRLGSNTPSVSWADPRDIDMAPAAATAQVMYNVDFLFMAYTIQCRGDGHGASGCLKAS